jgi:hypothetical protein
VVIGPPRSAASARPGRLAARRRGTTLAELTLAFGALAGAFFAVVFHLHRHVRATRRLYDETVALEWTRSQLEGLRTLPRDRVLALARTPEFFPLASAANLPQSRGTLTASPRIDDPECLDLRVTLDWHDVGGGTRRLELASVWVPPENER